jgi:hypothetical protein
MHKWGGNCVITVLDDVITPSVLVHHAEEAGKFIGLGWFRPERNGYFGRFRIEAVDGLPVEGWKEQNQ